MTDAPPNTLWMRESKWYKVVQLLGLFLVDYMNDTVDSVFDGKRLENEEQKEETLQESQCEGMQKGRARDRTGIAGIRIQSDNHYTTQPVVVIDVTVIG